MMEPTQSNAQDVLSPRIIKIDNLTFAEPVWEGSNLSGWHPVDDKILVLPYDVVERSAGGILLPIETQEKQTAAVEYGVIVEVGSGAFALSGDRVRVWPDDVPKPKAGDHVMIERYSGQIVKGLDGRKYRLLDDKCVGARRE
jgi:chaperonin GroES